jgi:putative addiction module component (TIGR02574 family)
MATLMTVLGIDRLSEAEKVQLAEEILDSLDADRDPPPISDALRSELDRRIAFLDANPDACAPWAEVNAHPGEARQVSIPVILSPAADDDLHEAAR